MLSISAAVWVVVVVLFWVGTTLDAHVAEALGSVAVAIFTGVLVWIGRRADKHFVVTERAYFQMSHRGGVEFPQGEQVTIKMQIKNWGRTPGTVTDQRLGPMLVMEKNGKLDGSVDYTGLNKSASPYTFLVPNAHYNWDIGFEFKDVGLVQAIKDGNVTLFMVGYVDYRDQFGGRWRAGYARKYTPIADQPAANNLSYVTTKSFNDDRARLPGEGVDWAD